ncbi:MAG: helix-turn-helix domain-containing protein [Clostridiales bacterium]|nr:helix-turn-helix domain-containing protein [Clostridiales bacterium]
MASIMETFQMKLVDYRRENHVTKKQMAARAGISYKTYMRSIENPKEEMFDGVHNCTKKTVERLLCAVGIELTWCFVIPGENGEDQWIRSKALDVLLKYYRNLNGCTQEQLALDAGLNVKVYQRVEQSKNYTMQTLDCILCITGIFPEFQQRGLQAPLILQRKKRQET